MKLNGNRTISADRNTVWNALTEPSILAECLPGADGVSGSVETGFDARIRRKIGFLDFGFDTHLSVTHVVPREILCLKSTDRGTLTLRLEDAPTGTLVSYEIKINLGNRLGAVGEIAAQQLGSNMSLQFFKRLNDMVRRSATSPVQQVA